MSFLTELNNYIKNLSLGWVLTEDDKNCHLLHLDIIKHGGYIEIEYHQEMLVRNGRVLPYNYGNISLIATGELPFVYVKKIVEDLTEIMRKHTTEI